jgi:outer membrane lipoprotein carrier protein
MPFMITFLFFLSGTMMKIFFKRNEQLTAIIAGIWILITAFFIAVPAGNCATAPPSIDEIITRLQMTYEKTLDFNAQFVQETTIKSIKKTEVEEGVVFFKNPKNMLWNYSRPKAKKLVINPRKAWLYLPQEKVAYVQDADYIFKSKVLIKFLSGLGKLKDDFTITYAEPRALDKNGNYLLILTPLEKIPSLNPFQITIDKSTFLILQVSFEDAMGNSTSVKFSNISTNTRLSEKIFQFQPPPGVSIFNMP